MEHVTRVVELTVEETRIVSVLLERAWPQINLRGWLNYFGLNGSVDEVKELMQASRTLCEKVGFDPPRPDPQGPRAA